MTLWSQTVYIVVLLALGSILAIDGLRDTRDKSRRYQTCVARAQPLVDRLADLNASAGMVGGACSVVVPLP